MGESGPQRAAPGGRASRTGASRQRRGGRRGADAVSLLVMALLVAFVVAAVVVKVASSGG